MRSKATVRKSTFQDIVGAREYADGKAESISGIQVNGKTISVQMTQPFARPSPVSAASASSQVGLRQVHGPERREQEH